MSCVLVIEDDPAILRGLARSSTRPQAELIDSTGVGSGRARCY